VTHRTAIHRTRVVLVALAALLAGSVLAAPSSAKQPGGPDVDFWLTVLHNNDGESQVIDAGPGFEDFGGAARFVTVVNNLREQAVTGPWPQLGAKRGVVVVSSGDNFLAGPEFNVSLADGVPFYDTIAMEAVGYDAVALGNHDFDFGPDVLADFLDGYRSPPPYISANLDFSGEPRLQAYVDAGVIAPATVVRERGESIGVIGIETPNLPFVSSPRGVVVSEDVAGIVQAQIDSLEAAGVNKIILASHLQNISNEIELAGMLEGLDLIVAGGGDELLANPDDVLIPGDAGAVYGAYPQMAADLDGTPVPVVTTSGEYRYVGRLVVGFDRDGNVVEVDAERSGPVRVATGTCNATTPCDDAVMPDPAVQARVVDPVIAGLSALASDVVATSEVDLDGVRNNVRSRETNEGNLIADSQLWWATQAAPAYGTPVPDVALQNGGGIRNDSVIPAGDITALDTFNMAPFPNFISIVPDVPREQFKELLENAVACTQAADFTTNPSCGSGRFPQIAGLTFEWSATGVGQILDSDGNVVVAGSRVQSAALADGTPLVVGGVIVAGAPVNVATSDFLAKGGDQYPFRDAPFTTLGRTYQQTLQTYMEDALNGLVTAAQYPEGGEGRITALP